MLSTLPGNTYQVLSTAGRTYDDGNGRGLFPGQLFVANQSSRANEELSMGIARGHIVEKFGGATLAANAARLAILLSDLQVFTQHHFGNTATQYLVGRDTLTASYRSANATLYGIVLDGEVTGSTNVSGTIALAGKFVVAINGTAGSSFTISPSGSFTHTVSALAAGDKIEMWAVDASDVRVSDKVTATVKFNAPVITTNPILDASTSITGTCTAPDGTPINLKRGGTAVAYGSVTSNAWTITVSGSLFAIGNSITATAGAAGATESAASSASIVEGDAPVITGSYTPASTSVSGTSTEPTGTTITLYRGGSTSMGTTTVLSDGTWTVTGLTLVGNYSLTAKAGTGGSQGPAGSAVVVAFGAPTVTSPIHNDATTVAGTCVAPDGTAVTVFKAGSTSIGTGTVASNAFSVTTSAVATSDSITAKIGTGANLSAASGAVVVIA